MWVNGPMENEIFRTEKTYKRIAGSVLWWLGVILCLAVIFFFSQQDGFESHGLSRGIIRGIKVNFPALSFITEAEAFRSLNYNSILRKAAHFIEYFILYLLLHRAMEVLKLRKSKNSILALMLCITVASIDELNQSFVPGRSPLVKDIFVDTIGAFSAAIFSTIWEIRSKNPNPDERKLL